MITKVRWTRMSNPLEPQPTAAPARSLPLFDKISIMWHNNNTILADCTLINIHRIFYLSGVSAFFRIVDIIAFTSTAAPSEAWGQGIILAHSILLFFYIAVLLVSASLRKRPRINYVMKIIQYIVPAVVLLSGIVIATIDQLVTTSITPLLIVYVVFGIVFLLRPAVSITMGLVSYFIYYNSIALTITDYQVLLSNRVNGATAVGLGLLLSIMFWHYNYLNITQQRQISEQQRQLQQMAYHDPLTNLYNRHFLTEKIKNEVSALQRYGHQSALILLDIDNFKEINDTHGHLAGDEVLVQLAQLITTHIRQADIAFRFGGEEFMILAPQTSLPSAIALAEKLRHLISQAAFHTGTTHCHITASFGVALMQTSAEHEHQFMLIDKALHLAKLRGKNRVETVL